MYDYDNLPIIKLARSSDTDGEARSYTLKHRRPYLVYIESFLDAHQIDNILNHKNFKPAHVDGERSDPTIRNNSAIRLPTNDAGLIQLCQRVARLTNTNLSKVEQLQLVRYRDNEQYHPHHDASEEHKRLYSFFVYLNDIPEGHGGETNFPYLNFSFRPKIGDALFWTNFTSDGQKDLDVIHSGEPLLQGEKFGLNIWVIDNQLASRRNPQQISWTGMF